MIVAYLVFNFAVLSGCGYKADPFYGDSKDEAQKTGTQLNSQSPQHESSQKKRVLFQEISSKPSASYEEDEE